jgi:hypothetical protein
MRAYRVRFRHSVDFRLVSTPIEWSGTNAIQLTTRALSVPSNRRSGDRYEFTFAKDQPWVQVGKSVCFVNETTEVINAYESEVSGHSDCDNTPRSGLVRHDTCCPSPTTSPTRRTTLLDGQPDNSPRSGYVHAQSKAFLPAAGIASPLQLLYTESLGFQLLGASPPGLAASYPGATKISLSDGNHTDPVPGIYLDKPLWPLQDSLEASLFQCFIRDIAPILDFCDHERRFERIVPDRAPLCPPLLNALLGVAAKRLGRIGNIDPLLANKYYQNCLMTLIPALSTTSAVVDENLLAAIILLRFMEESDLPFSISGPQSHLIGTRVFLAAQENICNFTGLRLTSFWIALRQETFIAMVHSRPVHSNLMLKEIATILDGISCECGYANRAIVHCASCIQYCFSGQEQSVTVWDELNGALHRWFDEMPWYFHWVAPKDDEPFLPNMPYRSDPVIAGMQHYYLARLLLTAHDPRTPKLGTTRELALDRIHEKCRSLVRVTCGISEAGWLHPEV